MSVDGMKELERKLDSISDGAALKKSISKATMLVRDAAVALCPVRRYGSGGGALRQSIYASVDETEIGITGTVFTNSLYAPFVEFGTGPVGQENHQGVAPGLDYVYGQTGWTIPANAMAEDAAEQYGFGIARGPNGEVIGYYTKGQPAQPFMYPALKNNEDAILDDIKTDMEVNIRKAIK